MGRYLIIIGIILIILGLLIHYNFRIPWIGKLPGDIMIKREDFSFYFPLGTSILLSVILSLILYLISKFR